MSDARQDLYRFEVASYIRRGPHGLRIVRCPCCNARLLWIGRNSNFFSTPGAGPAVIDVECECGGMLEVHYLKPEGAGWRRPLMWAQELAVWPHVGAPETLTGAPDVPTVGASARASPEPPN